MKSLNISIILFLFLACPAVLAHAERIEFTSSAPPQIIDGAAHLDGVTGQLHAAGGPQVPVIQKTFCYPAGTRVSDLQILELRPDRTTLTAPLPIIPARPVVSGSNSSDPGTVTNQLYSESAYPNRWFDLEIHRGLSPDTLAPSIFATVRIFPVRIHGVCAEYLKSIRLELPVEANIPEPSRDSAAMLIIGPEPFLTAATDFIAHKNTLGLSILTRTTEDIIANESEGRDTAEKIKMAIAQATEESNIRFVLLLGDAPQIPVRYAFHNSFAGREDWQNIPSDLYYADLYDGQNEFCTWDANENDIFGEYLDANTDHIDFMPDVLLGRIPAGSVEDLQAMLNKITAYETMSGPQDWTQTIALLAADTFTVTDNNETSGVPEGEALSELIANQFLGDYTVKKLYQTDYFPRDEPLTPANITQTIQDGALIVNYANHGHVQAWGFGRFNYTNAQVATLTNFQRLPIVYSFACLTGAFDTENPENPYPGDFDQCLGEAFLRNPDGGAVAFFGGSRLSFGGGFAYGDHMSSMGYLDYAFFQGFSNGHHVMGTNMLYSIHSMLTEMGVYDPHEIITLLEYCYFGDPSLAAGGRTDVEDFSISFKGVIDTAGGDGDGCGEPGETIQIILDAANDGAACDNVTVELEFSDPGVQVTNPGHVELPSCPAGFRIQLALDCTILAGCPTGTLVYATVTVDSPNETRQFIFPIAIGEMPYLMADHFIITADTNNDNFANPGEKFRFAPAIFNAGCETAVGFSAEIHLEDPWVVDYGLQSNPVIPDIQPGETITPNRLFFAELNPLTPHDHIIPCAITLHGPGGWTSQFNVDLVVKDYTMPIIDQFSFNPAEPAPGETVTVTLQAVDGNGVDTVEANFLSYGSNSITDVTMFDDGAHDDGAASDGIFGCQIQTADKAIFYRVDIYARDGAGYDGTVQGISGISTIVFRSENPILVVAGAENDEYLGLYTQALQDAGFGFDVWSYMRGVPSWDVLNRYTNGAVIWFYCHEYPLLNNTERDLITQYLDAGGNLFITEQDIGWAMVEQGTPEMETWYQDVLLAEYLKDGVTEKMVTGVGGDPLADGLQFSIEGGSGAHNQDYPSLIAPKAPAETCFLYDGYPGPETGTAGIRAVHPSGGKHVYLAFGFEGVATQTDRADVMKAIMNWFQIPANPSNFPWNQAPGWWIGPEIPSDNIYVNAVYCETDGQIYLAGGLSVNGIIHREIFVMDPMTGLCHGTGVSLEKQRIFGICANLQDNTGSKIYFMDGMDENQVDLDSCEVYDPATNSVEKLTQDPVPFGLQGFNGTYAVANNKVYVMGYFDQVNFEMNPDTWVFDPMADPGSRWSQLNTAMNVPRFSGNAAVLNNKIYLMGGTMVTMGEDQEVTQEFFTTVEVLDLNEPNPQWNDAAAADLPEPLFLFGAAAIPAGANVPLENSIITSRGLPLTESTLSYIYDAATDTWEEFYATTNPRMIRNPLLYVPSPRGPELWLIGGHQQDIYQNSEIFYLGADPFGPWIGVRTNQNGVSPGASLTVSLDIAGDAAATPIDCYLAMETCGLWFFITTDPMFPNFTETPLPLFANAPIPEDITYSGPLIQIPLPADLPPLSGSFYAATLNSTTGELAGGFAWTDFVVQNK